MVTTRIHINNQAVSSFIQPGGSVHDVLTRVVRNTRIYSKEWLEARGHKRSHRLINGIQTTLPKTTGPWTALGEVRSTARHSLYVHEGVHHRIYGHPFLLVPTNRTRGIKGRVGAGQDAYREWRGGGKQRGKRGFVRMESVRGQSSKPFLREGLRRAMTAEALT